ncbi:hypothetical protein FOA52_014794 [Chlamydomonas sp. UWO 241]|nr:hypothetical protein FOA52_014794 [Chlamydomonas sp. UWO 241]
MQPYLSTRALNGFHNYKYKATGYTYLDVLHTPFWNWFTELLPMWLAPNLITLTGLCFVFASFGIDALLIMDYYGSVVPMWVYVFRSVAVVVYVNLDCIDGKQARRTGSSSPLGQLFDHGCDALSIRLLLDTCHATLNYPCNWTSALIISWVMLPWILAHWEEYHTGHLHYGNGYFGVMESNYALCIVHFSGYFLGGNGLWETPLNGVLPFKLPFTIVVRHLYFAAFILGAASQVFEQAVRMLRHRPEDLPADERGYKELGRGAMARHLGIVVALLALGTLITSEQGAYGSARAVSVAFGLMYALVASSLIVAHMSKEPVPVFYWVYGLLALAAANRFTGAVDSRTAALVLMGLTLVGYLHYVISVVNQICDYLGIRCFVIKPKAPPAQGQAAAKTAAAKDQ